MEKLYRPNEVCARLGIRRPTLWRWRKAGIFPPAVKLGPNTIAWAESTLEEWERTRPAVDQVSEHKQVT